MHGLLAEYFHGTHDCQNKLLLCLLFQLFFSYCVAVPNFDITFISSYYILLYHSLLLSLSSLLLSKERQKMSGIRGETKWGGTVGSGEKGGYNGDKVGRNWEERGIGNYNQDILHEARIYFQYKRNLYKHNDW